MSLLGNRVPVAFKVFLATTAIVDDLAAIIIAIFYTLDLSALSLTLAAAGSVMLALLNRAKVRRLAPYMLTALFIRFCVLKSGVHATLAGVVVAAFIPLRANDDTSPARHLEHILHPWVAFAVLPAFAFANAGVSFSGLGLDSLTNGVALLCGVGFTMSLFIGSLAFERGNFDLLSGVKLGVLAGSLLSAVAGLLVLNLALPKQS